jgi:hypothetical protein
MNYFVRCVSSGLYKIGYTGNQDQRLRDLQSMNGGGLEFLGAIPGSRQDETRVHQRFAHLRRHGEWFEAGKELVAFVRQVTVALARGPQPPNSWKRRRQRREPPGFQFLPREPKPNPAEVELVDRIQAMLEAEGKGDHRVLGWLRYAIRIPGSWPPS